MGDRQKYDAILARIKNIFNVKLAPWDNQPEPEQPKTLADFPHVVGAILDLWEGDEVVPYLESLLVDNREGTRDGFDLTVYRDIMRLIALAKDPNRPKRRVQIMHDEAYGILFAAPSPQPAAAPAMADDSASPAPAPRPQIRERPKYITASYERTLAARGKAVKTSCGARPAAAEPDPSSTEVALIDPNELQPAGAGMQPDSETMTDGGAQATDAAIRQEAPNQAVEKRSERAEIEVEERTCASGTQSTTHLEIDPSSSFSTAWNGAGSQDAMSPMAIKLHLAIAYQDIGDNEGACLLLDEVIKGGSAEQAEQARLMLAGLA